MTILEIIGEETSCLRAVIFRRENGTFGLDIEKYSDYPDENCWIPIKSRTASFFDNLEAIRTEAFSRLGIKG